MTSCTVSLSDSKIDNPEKETTIEIQKNVIDTCATLASDGTYIYVMEDNLVKYRLSPDDDDHSMIADWWIFTSVALVIVVVLLLGHIISNE